VLKDHGEAELVRRRRNFVPTDDGERRRGRDLEASQRLVLRYLGNLELQGALAIYDNSAVALEPRENGAGMLDPFPVYRLDVKVASPKLNSSRFGANRMRGTVAAPASLKLGHRPSARDAD
jgi:hypothetical protein